MKKYLLIIISNFSFLYNANAQSLWQKQFGIDFQMSKLLPIDDITFGQMLKTNQKTKLLPSPYFLFGRTLSEKLSLQFGLQYQMITNTTHYTYTASTSELFYNTLNFKIHYLGIPINLNYTIVERQQNSIQAGLGILNNLPFANQFNYDGAYTLRGTDNPDLAPKFNMHGNIFALYRYQLKNKNSIGFKLFVANSFNTIFSKTYTGIGSNTYSKSKLLYYGLGINYSF